MPRRDSGLPHDTRNITDTSRNVFERPSAQEGRSSTVFNNSKNWASSSQELGPDTTGTTRRRESEMKREPLNTSIPSLHFQSGGGMLNHTGGTYSHSGLIDCPRFPISELHLENFLTPWKFTAGKSTSRLKLVRKQHILISHCTGSKKWRWQSQLTNL